MANNKSFSDQLFQFLKQAKTDNLKTKHFENKYRETKVKVSFGQGGVARIPWISFLKEPYTTSEGIYPVYLLYKNINRLVLAYGVSETNSPQRNWELTNPTTIREYFDRNSLQHPDRYGDSYLFKIYDIDKLPSANVLDTDLNEIIDKYDSMRIEIKENDKFQINEFQKSLELANLTYTDKLITRYISSLVTKPFVLLSGLSGSGKTKLSQSFAQWICESEKQYCIVPVGADWTNREPLLGYINALDTKQYILPENGALELIIRANEPENKDKPYFLILDEMNLSHVERYFADFLSVMESKDKFKLHSSDKLLEGGNGVKVDKEYGWPKNLFVVGTVNIDETTYMFSPKVLDRANVIEFRVNKDDMEKYLSAPKEIKDLDGEGKSMGEHFVKIATDKTSDSSTELTDNLHLFFKELQKVGAEFGYRTASEIQTLFGQISVINPDYTTLEKENEKIDIAIMQKLLPKLHGSRRKLIDTLVILGNLCIEGNNVTEAFLENKEELIYNGNPDVKYPLSLQKIVRMYKSLLDNGFASYAEA